MRQVGAVNSATPPMNFKSTSMSFGQKKKSWQNTTVRNVCFWTPMAAIERYASLILLKSGSVIVIVCLTCSTRSFAPVRRFW